MPNGPNLTILNVHADDQTRRVTTRILEEEGFHVLPAATGLEALSLIQAKPDLLLLAVGLPDMKGRDLCRQIRANAEASHLPILHVSETQREMASHVRGLEDDLDAYLIQPVEAPVLLASVKSLLRLRTVRESMEFSHRYLQLANQHMEMIPLLEESVALLKAFTGCEAVGIRVLDEAGNIPYQAYTGFSQAFYELESPLSIHSHVCMCIHVITGQTSPQMPYFTAAGSFYCNGTTRLLAAFSEEERARVRGQCHRFGYESVALVPVKAGSRILGLVHLADPREHRIPREKIQVVEDLSTHLGATLHRLTASTAMREARDQLEQSVEERTAELEAANRQLRREIEERHFAQAQLERANRALRTLSAFNRTLIHAKNEAQLLTETCRLLLDVGGYRLAWVGFAQRDAKKSVLPAAQWGYEEGYLKKIDIQWSDTERGRGPTGTAIRTGRPSIARDLHTDSDFEPWRAEALRRGYASSAALPLVAGEHTLGALNIYASEPDAFDAGEVDLLMELADNLAYGISVLRLRIERKRNKEALQKSERELRVLSRKLLTAEEKERKHVARELHDGIGQSLSAMKFGLERELEKMNPDEDSLRANALKGLVPALQNMIEEVRRVSRHLRPSTLDDLGILATVSWFSRDFQTLFPHIGFERQIKLREQDVPSALKTVLYRVLQEALNNIAKHSGAEHVRVCLRKSRGRIELEIEDNGSGFDLDAVLSLNPAQRGIGLASMRERTELSGGSFSIESVRGKGTRIQASWPVRVRKGGG